VYYDSNMIEAKLTSQFLRKCTVLKRTFKDLISSNTIQHQFEDFILQFWDTVKNMTEAQFIQFVINNKSSCFEELKKYINYLYNTDHFQTMSNSLCTSCFKYRLWERIFYSCSYQNIWSEQSWRKPSWIFYENFFNWCRWNTDGVLFIGINTEMEKSQAKKINW